MNIQSADSVVGSTTLSDSLRQVLAVCRANFGDTNKTPPASPREAVEKAKGEQEEGKTLTKPPCGIDYTSKPLN
jgi:hypothetical protein